jgi:hypothetical protein
MEIMEITQELLQLIRERLEQVYFAKTNHKPDTIEMYDDGSFYCSETWNVSYGGTETRGEHITAEDLTSDLDEMVVIRKAKEEVERQEQEKIQKANNLRYEREQREKREAEYNKLKKEFDKR